MPNQCSIIDRGGWQTAVESAVIYSIKEQISIIFTLLQEYLSELLQKQNFSSDKGMTKDLGKKKKKNKWSEMSAYLVRSLRLFASIVPFSYI